MARCATGLEGSHVEGTAAGHRGWGCAARYHVILLVRRARTARIPRCQLRRGIRVVSLAGLRKVTVSLVACMVVSGTVCPVVLAADPHEDPATAEQAFSGASLFQYYANTLSFVLNRQPEEVETWLGKMPFANVPWSVRDSVDDFAAVSLDVTRLLLDIDQRLSVMRELLAERRRVAVFSEGLKTYGRLVLARDKALRTTRIIETTGSLLDVPSASEGSDLRESYDEVVVALTEGLSDMLSLDESILADMMLRSVSVDIVAQVLEELGASIDLPLPADLVEALADQDITVDLSLLMPVISLMFAEWNIAVDFQSSPEALAKVLEELAASVGLSWVLAGESQALTELTLQTEPTVVFVGERVHYRGTLTSGGEALAGHDIEILLNGFPWVTTRTDTDGNYEGTLPVPYEYSSEVDVQALFHPTGEHFNRYMSSQSPVVALDLLFYDAQLSVRAEDRSYPGVKTTVAGEFHYGPSPPPKERRAEVYLDGVLVGEFITGEAFSQSMQLPVELSVGEHVLTVSAAADGRYAPVVTSTALNVSRAAPILDMNTPRILVVPGAVELRGRIHSELSPLKDALIIVRFNESEVQLTSSQDGTFETRIRVGLGLGLIGSQELTVTVLPRESWHGPLTARRSILRINVVNCGGILVFLAVLRILLPRMSRSKARAPLAAANPVGAVTPYGQNGSVTSFV